MHYESEIVKELPKGLICWYDFKPFAKVLQITETENILTEYLRQKGLEIICISPKALLESTSVLKKVFDYILAVDVVEACGKPEALLCLCKGLLAADGVLLLGMDNRLAIRYFCGDRDPFTNRNFDGIDNYRRADLPKDAARCYSKDEIKEMLQKAGFATNRFYSVYPENQYPQLIFADDYLPNEELSIRYFPMYHNPDTIFLEEEYLYTSLIKNDMFHAMANNFLVECAPVEKLSNVNQVTLSMDRGKQDAMATIIRRDKLVEKRAVYEDGVEKLQQLLVHNQDLIMHGISVASGKMHGTTYIMPFVEGELASIYLRNVAQKSKDEFIKKMDQFRELILSSSEIVRDDEEDGPILKRGYFDLVPLNCFYSNDQFVFIDQEFCFENYPANVMITRALNMVYQNDNQIASVIPKNFFFERYGIKGDDLKWNCMQMEFLVELRKERELRPFHEKYRRNDQMIHTNRQRINFSSSEYQRLFMDIFEGLQNKKLILFGSGNFAKKFMALYGKDYPIYAVLDNNESKWETEIEGVKITSPAILQELNPNEYKVIICIKNYLAILKQLQDIGVKNLGIYDVNQEYQRKDIPIVQKGNTSEEASKKYHIGYIAGVFDLYHIGHLNMFKRAKEQCDHLIVGVVSDEGVRKYKKTEPFVPFEERIEMVRSCKYVDEAVEIPLNYSGTRDAYRLYHFDAQFSGSDYVDDPNWLAEKEFLEKHGAELVFFPYTEATSSSKLKKLIDSKLL